MSSTNNNTRIHGHVHNHDYGEYITQIIVMPSEPYYPRISRIIDNFHEPVQLSDTPSRSIVSDLERVIMLDVIEELFVEMVRGSNLTEEQMMEITMRESLSHYQTQEKKPDVKISMESIEATDDHIGNACPICISNIEKKETIIVLPCKHILHTQCIGEWVKYKPECPSCRIEIPITLTEKDSSSTEDGNVLVPEYDGHLV